MERLQSKLQTVETTNSALKETVFSLEDQLRDISRERDELRTMNEKSSEELRRTLEVCHCMCVCVYVCWCACACVCDCM